MLPSHHWYGIVPGWLIFTAMVAVAVVLFARRVTFLVRLLLKGKPESRWDHLPARIGKVLVYVIGQARLIGGDFWPGLMHATIFWGFIILTLGTVEFFGNCLLYTSDAADERSSVDLGGRRIIKKKIK